MLSYIIFLKTAVQLKFKLLHALINLFWLKMTLLFVMQPLLNVYSSFRAWQLNDLMAEYEGFVFRLWSEKIKTWITITTSEWSQWELSLRQGYINTEEINVFTLLWTSFRPRSLQLCWICKKQTSSLHRTALLFSSYRDKHSAERLHFKYSLHPLCRRIRRAYMSRFCLACSMSLLISRSMWK